jgi:hypothetical protein
MSQAAMPTEAEVTSFLERLRAFRDTLPEGDQRLLNSMYFAAMGAHEKQEEEVQAYWVAAGPRGVVAGGPAGIVASPWGTAYGVYYPRPYY